MEKRLQQFGDDTVLEIVDDQPVKTRLSQKDLERKKQYLEESIVSFQSELEAVNADLSLIENEKARK